jgi:MscS family membrane protein
MTEKTSDAAKEAAANAAADPIGQRAIEAIDRLDLPFWGEVKEVWNHGLFGVDIGSIIMALLIFMSFLVLREFMAKIIMRRLRDWADDSPNKIDDRLLPVLLPPLEFIPIILGVFFAGQFLDLTANQEIFFSRIVRTMIAFTIFWSMYRAAEPLGHSFKRLEKLLTPMMTNWIFKVLKMLIVFIGAAVVMELWGIKVAPLLAGLGLFGAAIALGAQDFFKNLIAGMSLISEKRFMEGDWILVENVVEGTVEEIGFRSTKVRRFDRAPIYVPNSKLADAVVTNFSRMSHRRIRWTIGLSYTTSTKQLKTICEEIQKFLLGNPELFAQPDEAGQTVRIDNFGETSINLLVNCFTRTIDYNEWMEAKEALAFRIREIIEEKAKASYAYPAQSIFIENLPPLEAPKKKSA